MQTRGNLLTDKQHEEIKAPFLKNDGLPWDLHNISIYAHEAYKLVKADKEVDDVLNAGLSNLRQGTAHG